MAGTTLPDYKALRNPFTNRTRLRKISRICRVSPAFLKLAEAKD